MVNVEVDDEFFDTSDVLSIDEEFQVWSCEPVSVEERRVTFLKKMGLFEEKPVSVCLDRVTDFTDDEVSSSSSESSVCESELQCCVREDSYESTNSLSDEELDDSEQNSSNSSSSLSRSFSSKKWLLNCFVGGNVKDFEYGFKKPVISKVKVKVNKKSHVELSSIYNVQEICGHKGKIWALKFSSDGKYFATGGEDGVVKIWRITLSDSHTASFIQQEDQPLVLFPRKAFHIEETPFQELYGHTGDVLDLAWSASNLLLSASKDKTVRLWRIGCDQCLHIFHHNNYVTCVEFNPVNENNFISGSIDGKARIWGLSEERVVAWMDVHDSISAICYKPNGNGFVAGCINGNCRFYEISGNDVVMEEQILSRRRNRVTGVKFCPGSSEKVMVSSDESKIKIFDKSIIHKFKASSKSMKQSSATFVSSAGKHILSVRRGSGVYLWNNDGFPARKRAKSSRSFEYFQSPGVSTATSWTPPGVVAREDDESRRAIRQLQSSGRLSRSYRVNATWPEEKLSGNYDDALPVGEFGITGAWRMVIVTASLDGVIRTFHNYGLPRRLERSTLF